MANPFKIKGSRECDQCGTELVEGDIAYFHNDDFICEECASEADVVCECGNYKKEQYPTCYECRNKF